MRAVVRVVIGLQLMCWVAFGLRAEPLRLVTEAWPPYVYEENGQPTGLDYEITREVLRRLGREMQLQFMPWKRCLLAMQQGQADGILDVFYHPSREASMQFASEPLSDIEFVLFYSRSRPFRYRHIDDLRGLVIGISAGYWYNDDAFRTAQTFRREEGPSHEANIGKLARHRVDLVVNDRRTGMFLANRLGLGRKISYNATPVGQDNLYLALARTAELRTLAQAFSEELRRFKTEPAYAELQARYAESPGADEASTP
ncbi:substrate-binding periplasmic protein [Pseudomonas sp. zjy_9]